MLAAFNARPFIERAIDSVLRQEGEFEIELLVVDDGSQDNTGEHVRARYAHDPRVMVLTSASNVGPGLARNLALEQASGDWLAVIDADDMWRPDRLARLLANDQGEDMIFDNLIGFDHVAGRETDELFEGPGRSLTLASMLDGGGHASGYDLGFGKPLIRRSFIAQHEVQYPALRCNEDLLFYLELLICGAHARYTSDALYVYTTRIGAISRVTSTVVRSRIDDGSAVAGLRNLARMRREILSPEDYAALMKRADKVEAAGPLGVIYDDWLNSRYLRMLIGMAAHPGLSPVLLRKLLRRLTGRRRKKHRFDKSI